LIRSANTGISSFISPVGEILDKTEVNKEAVITHKVGVIEKNRTVYTVCGDIILYFAGVFILICTILQVRYIYKNKKGDGKHGKFSAS
jgi:apolipoprotein N-acyltransferase